MTVNDRQPPTGDPTFSVAAVSEGDACRLRLRGEFDIAGLDAAQAALANAAQAGSARLVVDLSGLSFIDSSGLRFIIGARSLCEERGIELTLVRGGPAIQRIFEVTRLESLLPFTDGDADGERVTDV